MKYAPVVTDEGLRYQNLLEWSSMFSVAGVIFNIGGIVLLVIGKRGYGLLCLGINFILIFIATAIRQKAKKIYP